LRTAVTAARATAGEPFASALADALCRFPWISPGLTGFPYPWLAPAPGRRPRGGTTVTVTLHGRQHVFRGEVFECPGADVAGQRDGTMSLRFGRRRTWPPEDRAATWVGLRVAELLRQRREDAEAGEVYLYREVLSLLDGIDVRESIRNMARGERWGLAVRQLAPARAEGSTDPEWPFPICYIFSERAPGPEFVWKSWYAPMDAPGYRGKHFHGIAGLGRTEYRSQASRTTWAMVVHWCPLCWGEPDEMLSAGEYLWQSWVLKNLGAMPVGGEDIGGMFRFGKESPAADLVRLALTWSRGHATVVLPEALGALRADLEAVARGMGKRLSVVPGGLLPADLLARVRISHLCEWQYADSLYRGGHAAPGVESLMGEGEDRYRELDLGKFARPLM
jgi:hypothetical protein